MESELLTWQSLLLRFGAVFVLILINGFFVLAEFALVGTRQTLLHEKAMQGNRLAKLAEKLVHHLDEVVAATGFYALFPKMLAEKVNK